ncbi:MAG: hypothetical protein ABIO48_13740, partial [Pedococcus sp.]
LPFEGDDLAVAVTQLRRGADMTLLMCGVQLSTHPCVFADVVLPCVQGQLYGANHTLVIPLG